MEGSVRTAIALVVLTVSVGIGNAQQATGNSGSFKIEKTLLGPWDPSLTNQPLYLVAPDRGPGCGAGCGLAGIGFALLWDAAAAASRPVYTLSTNQLHFAYVSLSKRVCGEGTKICMVVDGQVQPERDEHSIGYLSFSADNKQFTYQVKEKGGKWTPVWLALKDERWVPVSDLNAEPVEQAPPNETNPGAAPAPLILPPSSAGKWPPSSSQPIHSPDGTRTAYIDWKRGWNGTTVVIDGQPSDGYGPVLQGSLMFSPESKHVAFAALKSVHWVVVVDGREGPKFAKVGIPIFSREGGHVAYTALTGRFKRPWTVVVDDRENGEFEQVGLPVFSADGKHVVFIGDTSMMKNKWSVVVDGKEGEAFDGLLAGTPMFRPDGSLEFLAHAGGSLYRTKYVPNP